VGYFSALETCAENASGFYATCTFMAAHKGRSTTSAGCAQRAQELQPERQTMGKLNRREFIAGIAGLGAAFLAGGCSGKEAADVRPATNRPPKFDPKTLAVAKGDDPAKNTRGAINALGGLGKLIRKGDFVVVKPNMAWNRAPTQAATTNPEVIAEIVRLCFAAGAGKVLVIDHIIDRPAETVLSFNGIGPAAEKAGAKAVAAQNESDYRSVSIPQGKMLKSDTCLKDILKADVFINVPIAKDHGATRLTLGMKNLMGCNYDRQAWHRSSSLDQCIADYASAIRPDLVVLDATRILLDNGPKGPGKTKDVNQVIAGVDQVAVDAYGARLFGIKPSDIGYIKCAAAMGIGEIDLSKIVIKSA
jgi:uncharacterized protein (DUF362 family)